MKELAFFALGAAIGALLVKRNADNNALRKENDQLKAAAAAAKERA